MELAEGIFETLINRAIKDQLKKWSSNNFFIGRSNLEKEEAAFFLSSYIYKILKFSLREIKGEDSVKRQIEFSNSILHYISEKLKLDLEEDLIETEGKILNYILGRIGRTDQQLENHIVDSFPQTGLTDSTLFTGSNSDLSIDTEIEKDIKTSDKIYWIVSFIKWSGIRIFEQALKQFTSKQNSELKIITTTYMGASEPKALEFLANLPNTEIKISYLTEIERLHAKSYFFQRINGFDIAYIGSSNLSKSALTKGLEWNIRVTSQENPHIIEKAKATFQHYWNSPDFENFTINDIERFRNAITAESKVSKTSIHRDFIQYPIQPFQKDVLEKLLAEREIHGRNRNLIVAATGTGKTFIAAYDYRRFWANNSLKSNLLFIAHRKEILEQAIYIFRSILGDRDFGELWVGEHFPKSTNLNHLFISVQSFHSNRSEIFSRCPSDFYDFLIIDEAHHSKSNTYRPILDYFKPKILLGLTATPERMDGKSLLPDFDNRIACDIRLPDALALKLLTPFQYFCITDDSVDLRNITWSSGKYDINELTQVLSIDKRVKLITNAVNHYLTNPFTCKALCFCSSEKHAAFMSNGFNNAGLKSNFLLGRHSDADRIKVKKELISGHINFLFVVDIYNEGVDIPEIETILFLRPTESLTIFLQQLGRGLRLSTGKDFLTVLDFVSQAHQNFNFSQRFRSLVGKTDINIKREIQSSFPNLPPGCTIRFEKQAKEYILKNISQSIFNINRLLNEIAIFEQNTKKSITLHNFINYHELDIRTVYQNERTWSKLLKLAGIIHYEEDEYFNVLSKGIRRLIFIDSPAYLKFISNLIKNEFKVIDESEESSIFSLMFYYDVWQKGIGSFGFKDIFYGISMINKYPQIVSEISEIVNFLYDKINHITTQVKFDFPNILELHSRYSRDQLLAAFRKSTPERPYPSQEGVVNISEINVELLLVTFEKSEKDYSPSTLFEDYAITEKLFHWQSQNKTSPESPVGVSYINHMKLKKTLLLFVREKNKDTFGFTCPYYFLGPVHYNSHSGARPMNIIWDLKIEMPAHLWHSAAKVAVG